MSQRRIIRNGVFVLAFSFLIKLSSMLFVTVTDIKHMLKEFDFRHGQTAHLRFLLL